MAVLHIANRLFPTDAMFFFSSLKHMQHTMYVRCTYCVAVPNFKILFDGPDEYRYTDG